MFEILKFKIRLVIFLVWKPFFRVSGLKNYCNHKSYFHRPNNIEIGYKNTFISSIVSSKNIISSVKIGDFNHFSSNSIIDSHGGYVKFGNNNFIGHNTIIQGLGGVEIGDDCMIASNVFISSSNHDFSNPMSKDYLKNEIGQKVRIANKVWIGANSVITAGVNIGSGCIIAAGSVVTKDLKPYSICVGVPCKAVKEFDFEMNKWILLNKIS